MLLAKLTLGFSALVVFTLYCLAVATPVKAGEPTRAINFYCINNPEADSCSSSTPQDTTSSTAQETYYQSISPKSQTQEVPEPNTVAAMLLTGAAIIYSRKKHQQKHQR